MAAHRRRLWTQFSTRTATGAYLVCVALAVASPQFTGGGHTSQTASPEGPNRDHVAVSFDGSDSDDTLLELSTRGSNSGNKAVVVSYAGNDSDDTVLELATGGNNSDQTGVVVIRHTDFNITPVSLINTSVPVHPFTLGGSSHTQSPTPPSHRQTGQHSTVATTVLTTTERETRHNQLEIITVSVNERKFSQTRFTQRVAMEWKKKATFRDLPIHCSWHGPLFMIG